MKTMAMSDDIQVDESSSEEDSSSKNAKQSYSELKSKRKTLIKIEKLTDSSGSRSRAKMRRRALSPPSSSDEENLWLGWIAYPASFTSIQKTHHTPRREMWIKAARIIFSPVAKVCQKCIRNKVGANVKK